jgi:hypothetical protein
MWDSPHSAFRDQHPCVLEALLARVPEGQGGALRGLTLGSPHSTPHLLSEEHTHTVEASQMSTQSG